MPISKWMCMIAVQLVHVKCYWASRSLAKPTVDYVDMPGDSFLWDVWATARYTKEIDAGEYGRFIIAEE